jgi:HEAT repeat protein
LGGNFTMEQTVKNLKDRTTADRWRNVIALEKLGEPAVNHLIAALKDEDKWVRYTAADALGNIGGPRSVDYLIPLLKDPDQDVRFVAAEALGRLGDPRAGEALSETCRGDNCFVRIAAEEALAKISRQ